jgi:hypothetical protein
MRDIDQVSRGDAEGMTKAVPAFTPFREWKVTASAPFTKYRRHW